MRIIHCFADIGGNASGLAAAQRDLGVSAEMVSFATSPLGFSGDRILVPQGANGLRREAARLGFLLHALRSYDVIHFYFGDTFLTPRRFPSAAAKVNNQGSSLRQLAHKMRAAYCKAVWMRDLPLLKTAGKTIAMTFLGDDIRTVAFAEQHNSESHLLVPENRHLQAPWDADKDSIIKKASRYADLIYATNPDLLALLPERAQFLPYCNIDPHKIKARLIPEQGPLHIAHAPTQRATKGTAHVLAAIEQLQADGNDFTFDLIEGAHYQQARDRMARADIFIDQLKVGWYGGACVEAMAMGALCVAYLHPADVKLSPYNRQDLPLVQASARTLTQTLRNLLGQPRKHLQQQATAGRSFVNDQHDPNQLALRVLQDYSAALT